MPREWTDLYDNGALKLDEAAREHLEDALHLLDLDTLADGEVRVCRLLVYEGEQAAVLRTLGRSLNDGCRDQRTYRIHARTLRQSDTLAHRRLRAGPFVVDLEGMVLSAAAAVLEVRTGKPPFMVLPEDVPPEDRKLFEAIVAALLKTLAQSEAPELLVGAREIVARADAAYAAEPDLHAGQLDQARDDALSLLKKLVEDHDRA